MYKIRVVTQDEDGRYVDIGIPFDGLKYETYEQARNECVPVLKAIAQTLDLLYNDENEVWFEIIESRWGAVAWEIRAKDCSTLTPFVF